MKKSRRMQLPQPLIQSENKPLIMAHRGNRAKRPENSFAAFDLALEEGANILETDLRVTKDNEIICFHDETIDEKTTGSGAVADMTLAELKEVQILGAGSTKPQAIPSLPEFLDAYSDRTFFALELKEPAFETTGEAMLLLKTLTDHQCLDKMIIISFNKKALDLIATLAPSLPLAHIAVFLPWPSPKYSFVGAIWPMFFLNPFFVRMAHNRGQTCCPLDPKPEPRLKYYLWQGVDVLLTDDPGLTIRSISELRD